MTSNPSEEYSFPGLCCLLIAAKRVSSEERLIIKLNPLSADELVDIVKL